VRARRKGGGWGAGEKRCEERGSEEREEDSIHGFASTDQNQG